MAHTAAGVEEAQSAKAVRSARRFSSTNAWKSSPGIFPWLAAIWPPLQLAVSQPLLDMPEVLWKAFIDFETELGEFDRTRELYEKLLERTSHVKVWTSYANFEASLAGEEAQAQARHVYETGDKEVS